MALSIKIQGIAGGAMRILAIDPGTEKSAFVILDSCKQEILSKGIFPNADILNFIRHPHDLEIDRLCVEMIASYGMPVGKEIFETCLFIGQIKEVWRWIYPNNVTYLIYRKDIKLHFCQSARAKDSNLRQALIDRFGIPGTKKSPGKLYGIKADEWSALALAVYFQEAIRET